MFQQNKCKRFNRSALSVLALAVAVMASAPACSKAPEPAKNEAKSMSSEPMDHSKMDGMKMGGMKHMDGMSMTGDTDYDFAANMRMHHQMAVDMSEYQIKNGKSPELNQMAKDIIAAQKKEIAVLDQWIAAHKKP
ncbi:MAG: DUF305 domain-containing protein [Pseudomonadota bacterium]